MLAVKVLAEARFRVVGMLQGGSGCCPAEDFLVYQDASTAKHRSALLELLERVSSDGLDGLPSSLCHLVDKRDGIYEFIKGPLRLFFFKGANGDIAVCTGGLVKQSQKVDAGAVRRAVQMKQRYESSLGDICYIGLED